MSSELFSPLELRSTTAPNRVMVSPMCQYSCEARDGHATDWHRTHLGARAAGGAGIVMTEATAVEARGRISPEDLGIWDDAHVDSLAPITAFVREQGGVPAIQLAHAGRKAATSRPWEGHDPLGPDEGGWNVVGPTDDPWPYEDAEAPPTDRLDRDGIDSVIDSFRAGAERALEAGFEIAEVHAAHGYLLHQFCSPVTNDRTDGYGGDFRARTRLLREVTSAVREVWPDEKPVFVRLSATDYREDPSWTVADTVRVADDLASLGVDLIDISSGGIAPDSHPDSAGPNYQLPFAERVREGTESDVAIGTVGGITTPEQAEAIVANDRADLVIVGREHLRDPHFTLHAARELDAMDAVRVPPQYRRAFE
jgi:2,4-dienoyl-CoA reductase-like NADH-dependent reductase (Old Yellow Enzyme family)